MGKAQSGNNRFMEVAIYSGVTTNIIVQFLAPRSDTLCQVTVRRSAPTSSSSLSSSLTADGFLPTSHWASSCAACLRRDVDSRWFPRMGRF